jgi:glycosyltransferase involved in cell wall biosynthesis
LRDSLGLRDAVDFPGWIPRADLLDLFARAWALVYPSLFEGFGLPVVEAMAAGVPVACSGIEPMRSISGDAALHFDPSRSASITAAILRLLDDDRLRARLAADGPRRAAEFSWRRTASLTLQALEEACVLS